MVQGQPEDPAHAWVANPDGSGAHRVFASDAGGDIDVTPSPVDPNVLYFTRFGRRPFGEDLLRGDLATGTVSPLVTTPRSSDQNVAISPDGTRIAYSAAPRPKGRLDENTVVHQVVHVANVDGSGDVAITPADGFAFDPSWSPDGSRLVVCEFRLAHGRPQNRLVSVAADGTGATPLTGFGHGREVNPNWLPDGSGIVFERLRHTGRRSDILRIGAGGGPATTILATKAYETNPVPSPDGTRILFSSDRDHPGGDRLGGGFELYTMNLDGTGIVRLTDDRRPDVFPDWQRLP